MHAKLIFCRSVFPIKKKISKFGGIPNWIDKPTWPISKSTKRPMKFLCQIRLDQKIFPNCIGKMAYIFMSDDDKEFIDDTYEPEGGENAVINLETSPPLSKHKLWSLYLIHLKNTI